MLCVGVALGVLALGACGGDDDDAESSTTADSDTAPPQSSTTSTTTLPATTTTLPITYVTEGATVVVANASGINGAATRLSDRLAAVGFTMGAPGNSAEGQLATTKIYAAPGDEAAHAVATSLAQALGGGAITVVDLPAPPPVQTGDLAGATVLVTMANDVADKTLDQLQGRAPIDDTGDTGDTGTGSATAGDARTDTASETAGATAGATAG